MSANLILPILKGAISFLPGFRWIIEKKRKKSRHSAYNAEFCYALWLSSVRKFEEHRIITTFNRLGEIGTGGSLGVGICALLSGCNLFYALEIEQEFDIEQNLNLLEKLIKLFREKEPINIYSQLNIKTDNYNFPSDIIVPNFLNDDFIKQIRADIESDFKTNNRIVIVQDWERSKSLQLELIISRAVMEHVFSPSNVYKACFNHISPQGFMLHDIEFHSHGLSAKPNGHLDIPPFLWKIIFGKRKYFLNRFTMKEHLDIIRNLSFNVISIEEKYVSDKELGEKSIFGAIIICEKI